MKNVHIHCVFILAVTPVFAQAYPVSPGYDLPRLQVSTVVGSDFGSSSSVKDDRGNTYYVDSANHAIMLLPPSGPAVVFSGMPGVAGADLGLGRDNPPKFNNPTGLALGPDGLLYVADSGNRVIRKLLSRYNAPFVAGHPSITGPRNDGCGETAIFSQPSSIKVELDGSIYIWDNGALRRAAVHNAQITEQPHDQTVRAGVAATVHAEGVTFQPGGARFTWYQGQSGDPANSHFILAPEDGSLTVTPAVTTTYWASFYDGCSRAATRTATVTVAIGGRRRSARH